MTDLELANAHVTAYRIHCAKERLGRKWILHIDHGKPVTKNAQRSAIELEQERIEAERLRSIGIPGIRRSQR